MADDHIQLSITEEGWSKTDAIDETNKNGVTRPQGEVNVSFDATVSMSERVIIKSMMFMFLSIDKCLRDFQLNQ